MPQFAQVGVSISLGVLMLLSSIVFSKTISTQVMGRPYVDMVSCGVSVYDVYDVNLPDGYEIISRDS